MANVNLFESPLFLQYGYWTIKRFQSYHIKHPHIYEQFKAAAYRMRKTGMSRYSADAIMHHVRWNHDIATGERMKINNNYVSLYGRLLMAEQPETFGGFFEVREPISG